MPTFVHSSPADARPPVSGPSSNPSKSSCHYIQCVPRFSVPGRGFSGMKKVSPEFFWQKIGDLPRSSKKQHQLQVSRVSPTKLTLTQFEKEKKWENIDKKN